MKLDPPSRIVCRKCLLGKYLALKTLTTRELGLLMKFHHCFLKSDILKPWRLQNPIPPLHFFHTHILPSEPLYTFVVCRIRAPPVDIHHFFSISKQRALGSKKHDI